MKEVLEKVEDKITELMGREGVRKDTIDYLSKLVDIHKDIKNEEYWKKKEEKYDDEKRKLWCQRYERSLHG